MSWWWYTRLTKRPAPVNGGTNPPPTTPRPSPPQAQAPAYRCSCGCDSADDVSQWPISTAMDKLSKARFNGTACTLTTKESAAVAVNLRSMLK